MSTSVVLYGPAVSSYVRTARMTCIEKGIPHTLEPLEAADHEKLHPWSRVPILRHGDVQLYETSAITRYLDESFDGPSLQPSTAYGRAVMEQWISAMNCYIYDAVIRNYALKYVLPKFRGEEVDRAQVEAGVPGMQRNIQRLDTAYEGKTWIAGERLSLADLFVAPIAATVAMFPEGRAAVGASKNLSRALQALSERKSFREVHAGLG